MAPYINDLRATELATGVARGAWGATKDVYLVLLSEDMGVVEEAVCIASPHTITIADRATDQIGSTFLRLPSGGKACTVCVMLAME